jgi:glutamate N-acetyltransferase / amino-acid N-acetyltransferase
MAVGLSEPESISPIPGIKLASLSAGIKKNNKTDLVLISCGPGTSAAAVFTRNAFCAAPVIVAKSHLSSESPRALLINSGNANAGTGDTGLRNAEQSCQLLADALGCDADQVLPFSTGVIGQQLPMDKLASGIERIVAKLEQDQWLDAAKGIMTTDTVAKGVSRTFDLDGKTVTISGIAKGAGMIRPDMATMLSFIATDAVVDSVLLQKCLDKAIDISFNSITVDGDTSTNDACVLLATGQSGVSITNGEPLNAFTEALQDVCRVLAQAIIRDAEGATKFVTIEVQNAISVDEARNVAYTIAHSPLVKTALFASDPNWGRILAAVGRSDIDSLDVSKVDIYLGNTCIVQSGSVAEEYTEEAGQAEMDRPEISIRVVLGRGGKQATVWTSDLSHEYVSINADYRS